MTCYILRYELGIHHLNVVTNKENFHRVIDDFSTEFEIYKEYNDIDCPDTVFYYIKNYWGDMQYIGFSLEHNEVKNE